MKSCSSGQLFVFINMVSCKALAILSLLFAGLTASHRGTIYWNPNVVTDASGKATFEYFNADTRGTYRVVVEGIDIDGNLGRQVYHYKVE